LLVRVSGRAVLLVFGHEEYARPAAFEMDHLRAAGLSAIETNVVGADAVGQRLDVEKRRVPFVDLEPDLARAVIPVEWEKARHFLHAGCFLSDARQRLFFRGLRGTSARGCERSQNNQEKHNQEMFQSMPPNGS